MLACGRIREGASAAPSSGTHRTVPTISVGARRSRYHGNHGGHCDASFAVVVLGAIMRGTLDKRYNLDGISFLAFIAGPTLPYCAQKAGPWSGDGGRGGALGR